MTVNDGDSLLFEEYPLIKDKMAGSREVSESEIETLARRDPIFPLLQKLSTEITNLYFGGNIESPEWMMNLETELKNEELPRLAVMLGFHLPQAKELYGLPERKVHSRLDMTLYD
jgi:alpha-glucosidase (family GH31 glycosyl hydrolase)